MAALGRSSGLSLSEGSVVYFVDHLHLVWVVDDELPWHVGASVRLPDAAVVGDYL